MKIVRSNRQGVYNKRERLFRYEKITRDYRCHECHGHLELKPVVGDFVVVRYQVWCTLCGVANDIIHFETAFTEAREADAIFEKLPEHLKDRVDPDWRKDKIKVKPSDLWR